MVYGAALPTLTARYSGFVNGDSAVSLAQLPTVTAVATASSHVGAYPITVGGAVAGNYAMRYVSGTLTITPAPLTITAADQSMTYGGDLPVLIARYTGLVNGDTPASLTTPPFLATVPASSHIGSYVITVGGAVDPDYLIRYQSGRLTINPALLTVRADDKSRVYGESNPLPTASYTGFVNGDDAGVLSGAPALTIGATLSSTPGSYPITAGPGTLSAHDYVFGFVDGRLTVTKASTGTTLAVLLPTPLFSVDGETLTASVSVLAPGSGTPTGVFDFYDVTTGSDLGVVLLINGTASLTTSSLAVGRHTLSATFLGDGNFLPSTGAATLEVIPPASLSGEVFADFNDDGQVDFGELGIPGVSVRLTGTDDLGRPVDRTLLTDGDGAYLFNRLRPGSYSLTRTSQPAGYTPGLDSVGTAGGGLVAADQSFVQLARGVDGLNYNYGEGPAATGAVQKGQTAGIGFWNNKNGQALILALNGGAGTQLGDWLAATLPHLYGAEAGGNDLHSKDNAFIAALFQLDFLMKGVKLDAQVLATALSVYATNATLDSTRAAAPYGFTVSGDGVGTATFNVGTAGDAFGMANNTALTVLDLLRAADAQAVNGILYNGDAARRKEANDVFSALNQAGDPG